MKTFEIGLRSAAGEQFLHKEKHRFKPYEIFEISVDFPALMLIICSAKQTKVPLCISARRERFRESRNSFANAVSRRRWSG